MTNHSTGPAAQTPEAPVATGHVLSLRDIEKWDNTRVLDVGNAAKARKDYADEHHFNVAKIAQFPGWVSTSRNAAEDHITSTLKGLSGYAANAESLADVCFILAPIIKKCKEALDHIIQEATSHHCNINLDTGTVTCDDPELTHEQRAALVKIFSTQLEELKKEAEKTDKILAEGISRAEAGLPVEEPLHAFISSLPEDLVGTLFTAPMEKGIDAAHRSEAIDRVGLREELSHYKTPWGKQAFLEQHHEYSNALKGIEQNSSKSLKLLQRGTGPVTTIALSIWDYKNDIEQENMSPGGALTKEGNSVLGGIGGGVIGGAVMGEFFGPPGVVVGGIIGGIAGGIVASGGATGLLHKFHLW